MTAAGSGKTFEYEGRALTAQGWAEVTGLPLNTVYMRLAAVQRGAWTMEELVTLPRGGGPKRAEALARRRAGQPAPAARRQRVRRSKEDGQLETLDRSLRMVEAAERIEAEIRKLRALVVRRRHEDCDCSACLPPTY